jgi:hypothetical protein
MQAEINQGRNQIFASGKPPKTSKPKLHHKPPKI